jgi:hypothetical protein
MQNIVSLSDSVVEVDDYRNRDDGMPEYVMLNQAGPRKVSHRSVYPEYEPPFRSVDDVLESSLSGRFFLDHEAVENGTRGRTGGFEPHGLMRLLFPLIRKSMARDSQPDLDAVVERLKSNPPMSAVVCGSSRLLSR